MAIPLWWKVIYSFLTRGQGYFNTLHLVLSLKHNQKHQPVHNGAAQHLNEMRARSEGSTRAFCCSAISTREWKMHFTPPCVVEMALWLERLRFSQSRKEIQTHCFKTGLLWWGWRVSYWKATSWKEQTTTWFSQPIIAHIQEFYPHWGMNRIHFLSPTISILKKDISAIQWTFYQCLLNPSVSTYNDAIYYQRSNSWSDQTWRFCKFLSKKGEAEEELRLALLVLLFTKGSSPGDKVQLRETLHTNWSREGGCVCSCGCKNVKIGWQYPEIWMAFDIRLSPTCDKWQESWPPPPWESIGEAALLMQHLLWGPKQGASCGSGSGSAKQWTSEHSSCISSWGLHSHVQSRSAPWWCPSPWIQTWFHVCVLPVVHHHPHG